MPVSRKHPQQQELEQADRADCDRGQEQLVRFLPPGQCNAGEDHDEQCERERARAEREGGEHHEEPAPSALERPEREQREGDPEQERKHPGENKARPDDAERAARPASDRSPLVLHQRGERECGGGDADDCQKLDPDDSGERVVQEAVVDEAVPPGVPEVVPEGEAVLEEKRSLVDVRGQVGRGWAQPDEDRRHRAGRRRRRNRIESESGCDGLGVHQRMLPV